MRSELKDSPERLQDVNATNCKEGQVLLEYMLMIALCIGLLVSMQRTFRHSVFEVWAMFAKEVAAGCPTCKGSFDPNIH